MDARAQQAGFEGVHGQDTAVQTLTRALTTARAHHAYRFEGPAGVGKELTAIRFARAMMCERAGLGCGVCGPCKRVVTLAAEEPHVPMHPDVVVVGRGVYKAVTGQSELTGIGVEQIRRIVLGRVGYGPHEGRALVFIVREAELLTPAAANSMLKTLEEPPPRTHFVLITSRPNRLLDTIRSRTLPVRFGPLSDAIVARILTERGLPPEGAPLAQGSAELALTLASSEAAEAREEFVRGATAALNAPDFADAVRFSESRKGDRETLRAELSFFAQKLANAARDKVESAPREAPRLAERHRLVLAAMDDIEKNVQPALALETMFVRMRATVVR